MVERPKNSDGNPLYVFAGGGTGGHLYPGIAVARELLALQPGASVVFACSNRAIDRRILDPLPYGVVPQPVRPLPRGLLDAWRFLRAWEASAVLARDLIRDLKPAAVLGLGGFAAAPVLVAASRKGIRTALLNPDSVPGKANRRLARRAEAIFTHFDSTAERFPVEVRGRIRCVGCPIRREVLAGRRDEAMRFFDLDPARKCLLVLGGSLGAESINQAFDLLLGNLAAMADGWQVLQFTGHGKDTPTAAAAGLRVRRLPYCDRMDLAYAAADLAVCRAGAATVAELAAAGKPAVFLPYPYHADQHQRLNAEPLEQAGAALLIADAKDAGLNAQALREKLLPVLREESLLAGMAAAAAGAGKPSAAADVAKWLSGSED